MWIRSRADDTQFQETNSIHQDRHRRDGPVKPEEKADTAKLARLTSTWSNGDGRSKHLRDAALVDELIHSRRGLSETIFPRSQNSAKHRSILRDLKTEIKKSNG